MKKWILSMTVLLAGLVSQAQLSKSPVTWTFSAVKTGEKTFEVHMKATIQSGWHLYSQKQPKDAIAIPTKFTINANPLFSLDDKVKEVGKMEEMHDADLGVSAHQYSGSVDFVQKIKLKTSAKTSFNGSVEFQTCDDKKCLPPKTINFSVAIK